MDDSFSIDIKEITDLLNVKVQQFNTVDFIKDDPVLLPHRFHKKQDIEIIGFIVALIAWGKRKMIIDNGEKLIELMGHAPHDYVLNYEKIGRASCRERV